MALREAESPGKAAMPADRTLVFFAHGSSNASNACWSNRSAMGLRQLLPVQTTVITCFPSSMLEWNKNFMVDCLSSVAPEDVEQNE